MEIDNRYLFIVGDDIGYSNSAMNLHAKNLVKLFEKVGYKVIVICNTFISDVKTKEINFEYIGKNKKGIVKTIDIILGLSLWNNFIKMRLIYKPEVVIFYGYSIELKLIKYCRRNDIKIIIDRVDWFEKDDRTGVYDKYIFQAVCDYTINNIDAKSNAVISISEYLYNFYCERKVNTFLLPPVFPKNQFNYIECKNIDRIHIYYAGSLGHNKDILKPFINALLSLDNNNKLVFDIYGVSYSEIDTECSEELLKKRGINFHGKVSHKEAIYGLKKSHFSILFRHNKRYAKAGFSTKFCESMINSIPVICNNVGGADNLIKTWENGIKINDLEEKTIVECLEKISKMTLDEYNSLKFKTFNTAKRMFLVDNYVFDIKQFIRRLK